MNSKQIIFLLSISTFLLFCFGIWTIYKINGKEEVIITLEKSINDFKFNISVIEYKAQLKIKDAMEIKAKYEKFVQIE
jgi:hypothetical protein